MDAQGWVPATAGISVCLADGRLAITRSGVHKGSLDPGGVMLVDASGQSLTPGARPSAETDLHGQLYRLFPHAGAVLHGHSVAGTVLSMATSGAFIPLAGYELLKAFEGQDTHDATLDLPIIDNDQDNPRLCAAVGVISLTPEHPQVDALRQKFLSEHRHTEDEIRFFVHGAGNFILHVDGRVWDAHCTAGDLISVSANTPHWFDAGPQPRFMALRVFTDQSGWVPHYTGQTIHERFPAS